MHSMVITVLQDHTNGSLLRNIDAFGVNHNEYSMSTLGKCLT